MKKLLLVGLVFLAIACQGAKEENLPGEPGVTDTPGAVSPLPAPAQENPESPLPAPQSALFPGKIAFHSERTGLLQIFVLDGATGETQQLTDGPVQAFEPNWSPDCQSLAYAFGNNINDDFDIYTMRADGSDKQVLVEDPGVDDWSPAWSPKGDLIAYQMNKDAILNICFTNLEGESQGCMEAGSFSNARPEWSPDGEKVAFMSTRDGGDWDIFVAEVGDATGAVQITHNDVTDSSPRFSPDGRSIVFGSERLNNYDIFMVDADGSNEVQLTDDAAEDADPRWVGNDQIVFTSARTLDWNLFLMNRDGSGVTQLTTAHGLDKWPVWCAPD